ncbi:hypothetical protein Tco_0906076, partial [Tanacetum coccineum]
GLQVEDVWIDCVKCVDIRDARTLNLLGHLESLLGSGSISQESMIGKLILRFVALENIDAIVELFSQELAAATVRQRSPETGSSGGGATEDHACQSAAMLYKLLNDMENLRME